MEKIRLDKIISDTGRASRREAAQLIKNGFVTVDGRAAASGAEKFDPDTSDITVGGTPLHYKKKHYFMMYKPGGCVTATEDRSEKTVLDLLSGNDRNLSLFAAGRLDKDAEGLLILTDDGDYVHRIISPSKNIGKTYYVETDGALTAEDAAAFKKGIILKDGLHCLPAVLDISDSGNINCATVTIREGKYHQVKRMLASRGKPVTYLRRISIGGLSLDASLTPGSYREMTETETESVFRQA